MPRPSTSATCALVASLFALILASPASAALAPPSGCPASASSSAGSATPVPIPTGPGVVTSTINVSGAGAYLADLNVVTGIVHTFSADLDVTLTSPSGTVVTLSTDNGAGNDNVFNGTLWDDSANPSGQVPYTVNSGLVTDQAYENLVTATPLVPEEALGAFSGENPNGVWTLTISDDLAGDGGQLESWSLQMSTLPATPEFAKAAASSSTPVPIPTGPGVVTSTINVSGAGAYLADLNVVTGIVHTFSADLDVTLTSPSGTVVTLSTDNGAGNDNVFNGTLWDDSANPSGQVPYTVNSGLVTDQAYENLVTATPLVPEEALGAFSGENPNGVWTLTISDDLAGDGGQLESWSLGMTTAACKPPVVPAAAATANPKCKKLKAKLKKAKAHLAKARRALKRAKKTLASNLDSVSAQKGVTHGKAKVKAGKRKLKAAKAAAKNC